MSGTLKIMNNSFDLFPVNLFRVLHKPISHTNNKGNSMSTMSKINNTIDQLSIESRINYGCLTGFGNLYSRMKRSSKRIAIIHIKTCQNIHHIFILRNEKSITKW
jgi:hypothetical protein